MSENMIESLKRAATYVGADSSGQCRFVGDISARRYSAASALVHVAYGAKGRCGMRTLGITVLFVIVFTIIAAVATVVWLEAAPLYTCSAILEARLPARSAFERAPAMLPEAELEALASKYASLVGCESVLQVALATEDIRATTWLQKSPDDALLRLQETLNIAPVSSSALIRISATGTDQSELPEIVNAVAESACNVSKEISDRGKQLQIGQLREERTRLADQRDRFRTDKAKLLQDADAPDLTSVNSVLVSELHRVAEAVSSAELEWSEAETSTQLVKNLLAKGDVSLLPQVVQFVERDPVVCGLLMRRAKVLANEALARKAKGLPAVITPPQTLPAEPAEVPPPDNTGTRPSSDPDAIRDEADRALRELGRSLEALLPKEPQPSRDNSKSSDHKTRPDAEPGKDRRAPTKGPLGVVGPTTSPAGEGSGLSDIQYELHTIDSEIARRKAHLVAVFSKSMIVDAEIRKAETLERLTKLRGKYRFMDVSVRGMRATLRCFNELDRQDKILTDQIDRIDSRLVDLRILLQGCSPVQIIATASTPTEPCLPKWSVTVPVGAVTGLVLGLLFSLILSLTRRRPE